MLISEGVSRLSQNSVVLDPPPLTLSEEQIISIPELVNLIEETLSVPEQV